MNPDRQLIFKVKSLDTLIKAFFYKKVPHRTKEQKDIFQTMFYSSGLCTNIRVR